MWNSVEQYIKKHQLLNHDGQYLVALSGGADSVALLLVLQQLGYHVEAAHCNFQLRGTESDRDEQFVVNLCQGRGVVLHRAHFDTREYATLHHVSIEMAARDLRYHYFEQLRNDLHLDDICVAHHRDDSVETVLMNLVRGTGIRGLQGIRPRNGHIVRPLLAVSRRQIEEYLHQQEQPFVTDSTNLVDDVVRNKLRLNIIPQLLDMNPAAITHIQQMAERVGDALALYDEAIAQKRRDAVIEENADRLVLDLSKLPHETVLYEVLSTFGFSANVIGSIADIAITTKKATYTKNVTSTGRLFSSATHDAVIDRGRLVVERHGQPVQPLRLPECGNYAYGDGHHIRVSQFGRTADFSPSKEPYTIHLDASSIRFPLTLRPIRPGDWFVPFGMTGRKLISDFLTDRKVHLLDKRKALVVCDSTNAVLWLVGYRTDNRFRISDNSERVLELSFNF